MSKAVFTQLIHGTGQSTKGIPEGFQDLKMIYAQIYIAEGLIVVIASNVPKEVIRNNNATVKSTE